MLLGAASHTLCLHTRICHLHTPPQVVAIFLAVDLLIFAYEYWSVLQAGGIPEAP